MPERLRIAQVAPIAGPVGPASGGSIEHLVWLLTEELVRRGHEVTLCATGDSETSARLLAPYARGYDADSDLWEDWQSHEMLHMAAVFEHAADFDVIHSHVYHYALPFTRLVRTPVVHTYHILPNDDIARAYARYPETQVAAISEYQRRAFAPAPRVAVVYNGVDTAAFPLGPAGGAYLLFLGRVIPDKGPREAIQLARAAGMPLVIAGPIEGGYFRAEIAPLVDGTAVRYIGSVRAAERNALLAGAAALLYPVVVPEPFGLVIVEALACGTPVLALARGAVPELVEPGVTGFYAPTVAALAAHVPAALALDRARIRAAVVARFDFRRMTDAYEALYARVWTAPGPGGLAADGARGAACALPAR